MTNEVLIVLVGVLGALAAAAKAARSKPAPVPVRGTPSKLALTSR